MLKIVRIATFLRLIDENRNISITNLSMWLSLYRLFTVSSVSYMEVGMFMISAAAYNYRRNFTGRPDGN